MISDKDGVGSPGADGAFDVMIEHEFKMDGYFRKTEMFDLLPDAYDSFCFLDTDTVLVLSIDQAFDKSERHGIAVAQASHYSLEYFWGFGSELERLHVTSRGLLQYNTGVVFFTRDSSAWAVMKEWHRLCADTPASEPAWGEQPYFTVAMELLAFNPYTLSVAYNYRNMGDSVSGDIRIWHSHLPPPEGINDYDEAWPPRRFFNGERVEDDQLLSSLRSRREGR